jgi:hypothetical protein
MTQQNLNFGTSAPNDGEKLATAFPKIQANFDELYASTASDAADLADHIANPTGAHASSAISYTTPGTGAVTRTVEGRLREVLTPKDFGAVADGVTDDSGALNYLFTAYSGGASIYIPAGTYAIASPLTVLPRLTPANYTPGATLWFDKNAIIKATASMTTMLTIGSDAANYSGLFENGLLVGGIFDCNFLADVGINPVFYYRFTCENTQVRNMLAKGIKFGLNGTPSASFEGMAVNCHTLRDINLKTITGISKANPGVVTTSAAHGLSTGDVVLLQSVGGMTEVNLLYFTATVLTPTTFSIGVDTSGYTTYTSGGSVCQTVNGKGITGVYFENSTDNHVLNSILTGVEIGIQGTTVGGTADIYDNKYTNVHVWNYLENGRLQYGISCGGDNILTGCQIDGPFSYAYRFTGLRNTLTGSNTNYTPLTYGGRDNTDYAVKMETGAGCSAIGCNFKAQSASARLAGTVTGDQSNFNVISCTKLNVVASLPAVKLPTGAVLDFAEGDVTVTHSANALVFSGAANGYSFLGGASFFGGAVAPSSDDGAPIGSTAFKWSDLFLASGAVVNFAAGDFTLTHSTGILTANKDIRITTPGTNSASAVTVGGSQTLTSKSLTTPTITGSPTAAGATWSDLGSVTTADINGGTIDGAVIGGASAAAATVTTLTVNTNANPDANDGAGLGTGSLGWSDLFLASGAVVNFNNGDVTLTHSSGLLTLGGGALNVNSGGSSSSFSVSAGSYNFYSVQYNTGFAQFSTNGTLQILTGSGFAEAMRFDANSNVVIGNAALATSATNGFLYIPTCAGTPSGVPTAFTGRVPIIFDTTGNKIWVYDGGWLQTAALT